jgi:peptidyl-prolyl cis-trans isomerase-like protein 2
LDILDIFSYVVGREKDTAGNLKSVSMETREILEELNRDYKTPDVKEEEKKIADKFNAVS